MKQYRPVVFGVIFLVLFSCTPKKIAGMSDRKDLFPPGSYQHLVHIRFHQLNETKEKRMSFRGVYQRTAETMTLVGLTPFGTTVFRIRKVFATKQTDVSIYVERVKKFETELRRFFDSMIPLLLSHRDETSPVNWLEKNQKGWPVDGTISFEESVVRVKVGRYDQNEIPRRIFLQHPKFSVEVEVKSYEM